MSILDITGTGEAWQQDAPVDWSARPWSVPLADADYRQQVWRRILASIKITEDGCWEWTKFRNSDGYGVVSIKRRMKSAHQVSLALSRGGLWSSALQVDHLCRNRACCNPKHLELVTPGENSRRGVAALVSAARQRGKTHCKQGHPYDEANTYVHPTTGHRWCRRCRADRMRGYSRKQASS